MLRLDLTAELLAKPGPVSAHGRLATFLSYCNHWDNRYHYIKTILYW